MPWSFRHTLLLCTFLGAADVAQGAVAPLGKPQQLAMHRPTHAAAPPSLAPADAASDAAAPTPKPYGGTPIDVLTYHYDNARTGWNQAETDLTPTTVASSKFVKLATLAVDGNVLAQPLLVSRFAMPDASVRDVLIVATGHNTIYAYDAQTYQVLWTRNLGPSQSTNDVGCNDVIPEYGISSTPVIQRHSAGSATMYVVSAQEPSSFSFHTYLHAINVATGQDVVAAREISPSTTLADGSTIGFDAQNQWSRAGLAFANNSVYVSIGSHCDNNENSITGWELRYTANALAPAGTFHTINTRGGTELASIWMTGFAPALDASGNLFVVTGNGNFTKGQKDWGESVLKLSPGLGGVVSKFTPSDYDSLNGGDTDFGSGGVMLLPTVSGQTTPSMAVAMGKSSVLYLLNQTQLGGESRGDAGALQTQQISGNGLWGGPAYYNGPTGPTVFAQTDGDVLRAFSLATTGTPALTQSAAGTTSAGYGGSIPVVASNSSAPGVVFLVRRSVPMDLEAYDATTLGAPLATFKAGVWSNKQNQNSFVAPMVANGRVYAPAYKTVTVFGLRQ